jgi:hypothetical protein
MASTTHPPADNEIPSLPVYAEKKNPGWFVAWMVLVTILSLGAAMGVGWQAVRSEKPQSAAGGSSSAASVAAFLAAEEKPWGQIECIPITIAPPLEFVVQCTPMTEPVIWQVPNTDSEKLPQTLQEIGLDKATCNKLVAMAQPEPAINGVALRPSREFVLALSPEERAKWYAFLSEFAANFDQVNAFRYDGNTPDEWFARCALPAEVEKLVKPLIYRHGRFMLFADLRSIESNLPSPPIRAKLLQAISRERTFLTRLKITRSSDIDRLVGYWGRGGRAKDIRPILESLAELEGEHFLDITHMLPSFARRRIYTYPSPSAALESGNRDCHWTSFNFFSEQPDDRFCKPEEVLRTLEKDYYRIYASPQFGDVVMFVVNGTEAIHTGVYLADDIVFTKNGSSSSHPWMLMKLDDLKDFYPYRKPMEVRYFRRSDL